MSIDHPLRPTAHSPESPDPDSDPAIVGAAPRPTRRRRRGRRLAVAALALLALLVAPTVSFVQAMTYPGSAPASVRAVEWVRDNGGGGIVDQIETWLYSRDAPPAGGAPTDRLPASPVVPAEVTAHHGPRAQSQAPTPTPAPPPHPVTLTPALPGEGVWTTPRLTTRGNPSLYTTWFRPDPAHTSVTVAAALVPQRFDAIALGAGTRQPTPGSTPVTQAQVPQSARAALVAVFNAGFKMADSGGGWYAAGRTVVPLTDGLASLVIDRDGRATIGAWNQGVSMSSTVVAVRQNLHLIVGAGQPVAGLADNNQGLYGTGRNQFQYTWRSGIGVTSSGDLVYVAGRGLNLVTLASSMARAGAVTAMELDIHANMVAFNYFPTPASVTRGAGRNLLTSMKAPPNRYLVPDQRDFFYLTARPSS